MTILNHGKIENGFRKLSGSNRTKLLAKWQVAAFADVSDDMLDGACDDILAIDPTALGAASPKTTAQAMNDLAGQTYGKKDGPFQHRTQLEPDADDVEINPRPALAGDGDTKAEIDPKKIYAQYNKPKKAQRL